MHFVDPVQKLWMQIDQLHLALMDMEESAGKLDYKRKLEACMKDYLSAVPLERRFYFQVTNNVLYQTVLKKQDEFNPVRTALAWDTLNTYASNLLTQPWRREFRELRLYCGVFKHQVEGHLIGAVEVLNLLGYRNVSGLKLTLEGPVDPDRVARVARDCLLAKTECEILRYIWEGVSSKYTTSWEEIVTFRRDYISTPEQAMRTILYRRREEEYYKQYGPPIHCPSEQHMPLPYPDQTMRYPVLPPYNPYPYNQTAVPQVKENGFRAPLPQYPQQGYLQPAPPSRGVKNRPSDYDQNMNENKYHLLDTNVDDVGIKSPLIPLTVLQMSHEDVKTTDEQLSVLSLNERPKKGEQTPSTGSVQYSGGHTIWDYVYRDLESQGYSKDLGERGNLLERSMTLESRGDENHISFDETDNVKRLGIEPRERHLISPRVQAERRFDYDRDAALPRERDLARESLAERRFDNEQEQRQVDRKVPFGHENFASHYSIESLRKEAVLPHEDRSLPLKEPSGPYPPQRLLDESELRGERRETALPRGDRTLREQQYDVDQRREAALSHSFERYETNHAAESRREASPRMENGRHFVLDDRLGAALSHQRAEEAKLFTEKAASNGIAHRVERMGRTESEIRENERKQMEVNEIRRHKEELENLRKQKEEIERRLKEDLQNFQSSTSQKRAPHVKTTEKTSPVSEIRPEPTNSDVKEFDPLAKSFSEGKSEPAKPQKWECQFCTYINPASSSACEICSKSKDLIPEAVVPLVSGGKECWKCTLVNNKEERICVACGASLEGSPTYI